MDTNETNSEFKLKPGRPTVPNSVRQQKLKLVAELAAKGETLPKGRPSNPLSKRQQGLLKKQSILNEGGTIKRGRPSLPKTNNDIIVGNDTMLVKDEIKTESQEEVTV